MRRKPQWRRKVCKRTKKKKSTNLVPRSKLRVMQKRLIHAERVLRSIAGSRCRSRPRLDRNRKWTDPRKRRKDQCICPSCSAKSYFKATMADEPYMSTNVKLQNWKNPMNAENKLMFPMKRGDWFTFFNNSRQKDLARNHLVLSVKGTTVKSRCGRSVENPWKLIMEGSGKKKRLYPNCKVCLNSEEFDKRKKS